jgi:hypothetical protein
MTRRKVVMFVARLGFVLFGLEEIQKAKHGIQVGRREKI